MRQAGFFMGIFLLVALCAVTDWTIRLIVVNAKMSGRNSYISIMDHCFGGSGRAAVSFFQFTMAFGGAYLRSYVYDRHHHTSASGMCAFGIIIGILLFFPE